MPNASASWSAILYCCCSQRLSSMSMISPYGMPSVLSCKIKVHLRWKTNQRESHRLKCSTFSGEHWGPNWWKTLLIWCYKQSKWWVLAQKLERSPMHCGVKSYMWGHLAFWTWCGKKWTHREEGGRRQRQRQFVRCCCNFTAKVALLDKICKLLVRLERRFTKCGLKYRQKNHLPPKLGTANSWLNRKRVSIFQELIRTIHQITNTLYDS